MPINKIQYKFAKFVHKNFFKKTGKLLELGSGDGEALKSFLDIGYNAIGTDIIKPKHPKIKQLDLEKKFPFKDNIFDYVYAYDIIEHIKNRESLWHEIKRVLKPNSLVCISVIDWATEYKRFYNNFYHNSPYTQISIKDICHHLGFKLIYMRKMKFIPYIWRFTDLAFKIFFPFTNQAICNFAILKKVVK